MKKENKRKPARPKTKLGLPDLEQAKAAVVGSLPSRGSKREYGRSIDEFVAWYCSEPRLSFSRTVVVRFRMYLEGRHLAPSTINLRLAAVRRLAYEASDSGHLSIWGPEDRWTLADMTCRDLFRRAASEMRTLPRTSAFDKRHHGIRDPRQIKRRNSIHYRARTCRAAEPKAHRRELAHLPLRRSLPAAVALHPQPFCRAIEQHLWRRPYPSNSELRNSA